MSNPICVYDFTLPQYVLRNGEEYCIGEKEVINWLKDLCKKWCFQLEMGDEGYFHYQGRLSLKVKERMTTLVKKSLWKEIHLSPTSAENQKNMFYVMKEDTRIEGPWKDDDPVIFIPRQVQEVIDSKKWYPWQQYLIDHIGDWEPRTVNCIYDPVGNKGKSTISSYLCCIRKACQIPTCNDYKDVLASVIDRDKLGAYLIDMPRGIHKESLGNFYGAIETIKSGYASDKRYKFREVWFDSPNVWVFTNILPDQSLLSRDRWKIWKINGEMELVPYTEEVNIEVLAPPTFVGFPPVVEQPDRVHLPIFYNANVPLAKDGSNPQTS